MKYEISYTKKTLFTETRITKVVEKDQIIPTLEKETNMDTIFVGIRRKDDSSESN